MLLVQGDVYLGGVDASVLAVGYEDDVGAVQFGGDGVVGVDARLLRTVGELPHTAGATDGDIRQHGVEIVEGEVVDVRAQLGRQGVDDEVQLDDGVAVVLVLQDDGVGGGGGGVAGGVGTAVAPRVGLAVLHMLNGVGHVVDRQPQVDDGVASRLRMELGDGVDGVGTLGVLLAIGIPRIGLPAADAVADNGVEVGEDAQQEGIVVVASAGEVGGDLDQDGVDLVGLQALVGQAVGIEEDLARHQRVADAVVVFDGEEGGVQAGGVVALDAEHRGGGVAGIEGEVVVAQVHGHAVGVLGHQGVEGDGVATGDAADEPLLVGNLLQRGDVQAQAGGIVEADVLSAGQGVVDNELVEVEVVHRVHANGDGIRQVVLVVVGVTELQVEDVFRGDLRRHIGTRQRRAGAEVVHGVVVAVGVVHGLGVYGGVAQLLRMAIVEDTAPAVVLGGGARGGETEGHIGKRAGGGVVARGGESGGLAGDGRRRVGVGRVGGPHLRQARGVLDADDAVAAVPAGAHLALFHMHLDDVRAFVAYNLVGATEGGAAVLRHVVPRADDLAARIGVLDTVVDAPVRVARRAVGRGAGIGVLIDSVDGVAHVFKVAGGVAGGTGVPRQGGRIAPGARGTCAGGVGYGHRAEGHQSVGSQNEGVLADAEEVERVRNGGGHVGEVVVRRDGHSGTLAEGGVWRVVGDGVHVVGTVETLHGDVGRAGEQNLRMFAAHHRVPSFVAVARSGGVVAFLVVVVVMVALLFDDHIGAGANHALRPLVFAAIGGGAGLRAHGVRLAEGRASRE